jgi:penicillin-binding protein 1A
VLWLTVPVIAILFGLVIGVVYAFAKLPVSNQAPPAQSISFTDAQGRPLGTISPIANRQVVDFKEIPPVVRNAVLAAEDRDFYKHGALSYKGLLRAAWANIVQRRVAEGGSTITQQYVKNVFPAVGSERTIFRKIKEAVIAIKLEHHYTKDQILGSYLNAVYFGHGAYGVQAAAHAFFNKPVQKLTAAEAATLAGAIRAPEVYTRKANARIALERRNFILDVMQQRGWLSPSAAAKAKAAPLKENWVVRPGGIANSKAPFFLELVRQYLVDQFGAAAVSQGGFQVRTTLDLTMQAEAEAAVKSILSAKGDPPASLVALDPRTGAVRAIYAGASAGQWATHPFNYATDAERQAGSTFKPFVLERALLDGITLDYPLPAPDRVIVNNGDGTTTTIHNFAGEHFSGNISLLEATALSVNTSYTYLLDQLARDGQSGPTRVAALAHLTGLDATLNSSERKPRIAEVPSLALGPSDVTTLQLASAFATWANQGVHADPYIVEWIKDAKGHLIKLPPHRVVRVIDANTANTMTFALRNVVEHGTGTAARLPDRQVAGKTGTTNDSKDARFVGYTTDLVTSVWMGYTTPRPMVNLHGVANVTGGSLPAQIFHAFMVAATQGTPPTAFPLPQQLPVPATTTTTVPPTTPPSSQPPATALPPSTEPPPSFPVTSNLPPSSTFGTVTSSTTRFRVTTTTR